MSRRVCARARACVCVCACVSLLCSGGRSRWLWVAREGSVGGRDGSGGRGCPDDPPRAVLASPITCGRTPRAARWADVELVPAGMDDLLGAVARRRLLRARSSTVPGGRRRDATVGDPRGRRTSEERGGGPRAPLWLGLALRYMYASNARARGGGRRAAASRPACGCGLVADGVGEGRDSIENKMVFAFGGRRA